MKVEEEDEEGPVEENEEDEEEEENLEKALSVERFGDIISDSASTSGDRMGRHYTEKDFECKKNCCVNNIQFGIATYCLILNIHPIFFFILLLIIALAMCHSCTFQMDCHDILYRHSWSP